MIKRLVVLMLIIAVMQPDSVHARDDTSFKISLNSTLVSITDYSTCKSAGAKLFDNTLENIKRNGEIYPNLQIPKAYNDIWSEEKLLLQPEQGRPAIYLWVLNIKLANILYNPNTNKYMYFMCDRTKENFVEILTIEQAQQAIDRSYAEYLSKKNKVDSEVSRILGK
jgi:hypothetical protein